MVVFNENVAMIAGINAAIMAELLKELLNNTQERKVLEYGKEWCRCSMKMATVYCAYLSIYQVEGGLHKLINNGIISKGNFNTSKFDHTNWYAFTEYGLKLMEKSHSS